MATVHLAKLRDSFRFESHMTEPVERLIDRLTQRMPGYVLREVQTGQGVVDLLAVEFDDDVLSHRSQARLGPIVLPLRVSVLARLSTARWASLERLSGIVGSNPRALVRSTIRPLQDLGTVEFDKDRVRATGAWVPLARRLTAIELKLSKWKEAARQADNAAWATDHSWVVLDRYRSNGAMANRRYFAEFRIGLALIDPSGSLEIIERPRRRHVVPWLRAWLGELAWARLVANAGGSLRAATLQKREPRIEKSCVSARS